MTTHLRFKKQGVRMRQIVYVASSESHQIDVFQLNLAGQLTLIQTKKVSGQVQPMAINPNTGHLYAGVRPEFSVVTYHIADDGQLEEVGTAALPAGPTYITTDPAGRFLFSASYSGNSVSISLIDHQGIVQKWSEQLTNLGAPHSVNFDLTGKVLFIPCLKEDRIKLFELSVEGTLSPHYPAELITSKGAGPRHMTFHPNNKIAYCINELKSSIDLYLIRDKVKNYTLINTVNALPEGFVGQPWAADIHMKPDGRYLYTTDRTSHMLSIFKVSEEGIVLSLVGYQSTEAQPRGFNIDHSGQFLISAGQLSNKIAVYRIHSLTGKLSLLSRYPVGKGPMWISILNLETS